MSEGIKVSVGGKTLMIDKKIGEGGFATIYLAHDRASEQYVLKKMILRNDSIKKAVDTEFAVFKAINGNVNLCRAFGLDRKKGAAGREAYVLMEYCPGGDLMQYLKKAKAEKRRLTENEALLIMYDICQGVKVMHEQDPPIAHRDLKPENVMLDKWGNWKLIDFGSSQIGPVELTTKEVLKKEEESIEKNTTQLYRAPEECDFFGIEVIDEAVDIWALGCIMYTLAYMTNPFQATGKLGVMNGKFTFPKNDSRYSEDYQNIIKKMLTPDTEKRADITQCLKMIKKLVEIDDDKKKAIKKCKKAIEKDEVDLDAAAEEDDEDEDDDDSPKKKKKSKKDKKKKKHHDEDEDEEEEEEEEEEEKPKKKSKAKAKAKKSKKSRDEDEDEEEEEEEEEEKPKKKSKAKAKAKKSKKSRDEDEEEEEEEADFGFGDDAGGFGDQDNDADIDAFGGGGGFGGDFF